MGYYDLVLTYEHAYIMPAYEELLRRMARDTMNAWHAPDLRRHEVEITEDGRVEHRLEFRGERCGYNERDSWFAVRCGVLEWETVSRPDRELPELADRFTAATE